MANAITAFNPEYWSARMQVVRFKESIYVALANFEERSNLQNGDVVHRPYRSRLKVQTYTKGTAVTIQDVSATDESLTVDTAKIAPFYVDDIDKIQNKWDAVNQFADDAGRELELFIDGQFLGEVANASSTVDDGDIGGTDGTAITLTTSNVLSVFAATAKKLNQQNIKMQDRFMVISPTVHQILVEYLAGRDSALGDTTNMNGHIGKFMGFDLYMSNNAYWTARWTPADNPSNTATITINGVTFTFVSSIGSTAGNVLIGGSTALTLDNLVALINAPTTTNSTQVALSDESQRLLTGLTATDGTTYLGLAFKGAGEIEVTTSEVADVWSVETIHLLAGQKKSIDVVIQKEPSVEFKDVPDKLGKNVLPWTLYGMKTFNEGARALVDVQILSSAF